MSSAAPLAHAKQSTARMIAASFTAGMGAMVLLGFVAPVLAKGGLAMANANAAQMEASAPAIQPLDVIAVQAQLADADRAMQITRATTDNAMSRLERLAR